MISSLSGSKKSQLEEINILIPSSPVEKPNADTLINKNIKLIDAVKNVDILSIVQLVKQGADPFFKDQINCSAIEYAVYGNHQDFLPILLGKDIQKVELNFFERSNWDNKKSITYHQILKEISKLNNKKELSFANIEQLKERLIELHQMILWSNGEALVKEVYKNYIILAACYATPEVLTELIDKGIRFDKVLDGAGRSLLHYTAVIAPKNFHLLSQYGLSINRLDSNKISPVDLLVTTIKKNDPISIELLPSIIFLKLFLVAMIFVEPGPEFEYESQWDAPIEALYAANFTYGLTQAISAHTEMFLNFVSNPTKTKLKSILWHLSPYLLMLPSISAPIGMLPLNILNISYLAINTFKGLKAAWQHSSYRPFKAILAALFHTANTVVNSMSIIRTALRAINDPFNETSFEKRKETEEENKHNEYSYKEDSDYSYYSFSGDLLSYSQVKSSLKTVLKTTHQEACNTIQKYKPTLCNNAIEKLTKIASVRGVHKACKELKVIFHPDKFAKFGEDVKAAAGRIFQELNGAKSGNCDSKMS